MKDHFKEILICNKINMKILKETTNKNPSANPMSILKKSVFVKWLFPEWWLMSTTTVAEVKIRTRKQSFLPNHFFLSYKAFHQTFYFHLFSSFFIAKQLLHEKWKLIKHAFTLIKICFRIWEVALKCCISTDKVTSVTDFSRVKLCWRVGSFLSGEELNMEGGTDMWNKISLLQGFLIFILHIFKWKTQW